MQANINNCMMSIISNSDNEPYIIACKLGNMIQYLELIESKVTLVSNSLLLIIVVPLLLVGIVDAMTYIVSVSLNYTLKSAASGNSSKLMLLENDKYFKALTEFKIKSIHWSIKFFEDKQLDMTRNFHQMFISRLVKVRKEDWAQEV